MTKKEKLEEAKRLKAAIDAKKPLPEKMFTKENGEKNNRKRYATKRSAKGRVATLGKYKVSKHFDMGFDKW